MEQEWVFNNGQGKWKGPDGWVYCVLGNQQPYFEHNNQVVQLQNVPQQIRASLEHRACTLIQDILNDAIEEELLPDPVVIQKKVNLLSFSPSEDLDNTTLGSENAQSGLIVFAVGAQQGIRKVVGAHLDIAQIYFDPQGTAKMFLQDLNQLDAQPDYYIFGGRVGYNTMVNPGGLHTMDYSLYYPLIQNLSQNGRIVGYKFPTNPADGYPGISAAINEDGVSVWSTPMV